MGFVAAINTCCRITNCRDKKESWRLLEKFTLLSEEEGRSSWMVTNAQNGWVCTNGKLSSRSGECPSTRLYRARFRGSDKQALGQTKSSAEHHTTSCFPAVSTWLQSNESELSGVGWGGASLGASVGSLSSRHLDSTFPQQHATACATTETSSGCRSPRGTQTGGFCCLCQQ